MVQMKGHEFEFKLIKPSLLKIDPLYQREIRTAAVGRIVQEFRYDLMNEPKVSMRDDGSYYIFNGQHTVSAWRSVNGGKDVPILCKVFRGLSWLEEKELFVLQNGISKDPTTNEKLRAEYNSGNAEVIDMVYVAGLAGITVNFSKGQANKKCIATSALFKSYKMLGHDGLYDALSIIMDAWGGEKESMSAGFILGISSFIKTYQSEYKRDVLVSALSGRTPDYFVREARDMNGHTGNRYARLFLKEYNKKRAKYKLGDKL